ANLICSESSDIAPRVRQASNEPSADRVSYLSENDGHRARFAMECRQCRSGTGKNHVGAQPHQLLCIPPQAVRIAGGPTKVDPDVAAVDPSKLLKSLLDDRDATLRFWIIFGEHHEHTDPPHPLALLRARRKRPRRRRAAEQRG